MLLLLSYLFAGHCQCTDMPCVSGSTVKCFAEVYVLFFSWTNKWRWRYDYVIDEAGSYCCVTLSCMWFDSYRSLHKSLAAVWYWEQAVVWPCCLVLRPRWPVTELCRTINHAAWKQWGWCRSEHGRSLCICEDFGNDSGKKAWSACCTNQHSTRLYTIFCCLLLLLLLWFLRSLTEPISLLSLLLLRWPSSKKPKTLSF